MRKYRFGIVGAGLIGPTHAQAVSEIGNAELVAVATTREETARPLAERYGAKWYTDYGRLLEEKLDIVDICTPPFLHEEMTLAAAERGKHVIVEKPIAVDLDQADNMIKICEERGVKLGVIFQARFNENVERIKNALAVGTFGKLIMLDAYHKSYRTQQYYDSGFWRGTWSMEGGGALMTQAIHSLDLLRWFGGEVESVCGYIATGTVHDIEVEDVAVACLQFENGALGVIEGSTSTYPGFPRRLEIHGEKGTVVLQGDDITVWDLVDAKNAQEKSLTKKEGSLGKNNQGASPLVASPRYHRLQIEDFLKAVEEDKQPLVNGKEGRKSLEIVLSIYESARERKAVILQKGE